MDVRGEVFDNLNEMRTLVEKRKRQSLSIASIPHDANLFLKVVTQTTVIDIKTNSE
jgi:hypothetical protein